MTSNSRQSSCFNPLSSGIVEVSHQLWLRNLAYNVASVSTQISSSGTSVLSIFFKNNTNFYHVYIHMETYISMVGLSIFKVVSSKRKVTIHGLLVRPVPHPIQSDFLPCVVLANMISLGGKILKYYHMISHFAL